MHNLEFIFKKNLLADILFLGDSGNQRVHDYCGR